jgi:hypothetical protein
MSKVESIQRIVIHSLLLITLFPTLLLSQPQTSPIIGGAPSTQIYPWMTALLFSSVDDSTEAHLCGGSLIASQYIATAAHCVWFYGSVIEPDQIEVMIGRNDLPFGRGDRTKVIGIFAHPNFNSITLENDVALLKIEKPLPPPYLNVLQPGQENLITGGSPAKVLGWGFTSPTLPILPVSLHEVGIPIHSDSTCLNSLGRWFKPLSMLCAGVRSTSYQQRDGKDACNGDSGGPLVVNTGGSDALAGVVSWGYECASPQSYGVYSDVIQLAPFLNSRPIAKPSLSGDLLVKGSGKVGEPLRCDDSLLTVRGDAISSKAYRWYDGNTFDGLIAETQEYTPSANDVDKYMVCETTWMNSGGESTVYSVNGLSVFSDATDLNITPIPTLPPVPSDKEGPQIAIDSKRCNKKLCSVTVSAFDPSGVIGVEGLYNRKITTTRGCSKKSCIRPSAGILAATSLNDGRWEFRFHVPRQGKLSVRLTIRGVDSLGNVSQEVSTRLRAQGK